MLSSSLPVASHRSDVEVVIPDGGVIVGPEMVGGVLMMVTRVAVSLPLSASVAMARQATLSPGATLSGSSVIRSPVPSDVVLFFSQSY